MMMPTATFTKVILYTDNDGRSQFREEAWELKPSGVIGLLSEVFPATGYQFRHSPKGYENTFHNSPAPQWVFVLSGLMEIELVDGSMRRFKAGESFYSADVLPKGVEFQSGIHGHISRQMGDEPLVTLFVKVLQE